QSGEIADGTVVIGESAFAEIGLDGEIHIPNTVETISSAAFAGDEFGIKKNKLKKVEIPSNVKEIEPGAFFNVDLEELILHEGLEGIGEWAFAHNTLVTVEIPSSMEYVGYYAFGQNDIKDMIIKAEEIFIRENAFDDNQTNSKDLTIYGYGNSTDVKSYADDNGYTFRSLIDYELNSDPENFGFGDIINVLDSDGEIIATLEIPENDATNGELGGAHIIVNAVDETDVVANGLEIAGAIVDIIFVDDGYDPDNLEDSIIKVEDMGDFILSLRVNEDAPTDIAMYHELGHDDWYEVGGKVANGFITATVTNFSKYGVFAEVVEKPGDPEDPDDPTKPGTPDPKDPEFDPCDSQDPIAAGCPEDQLKDDNGDPKVTVKGDDKTTPKSGGLLPKTATEMFNYLLVGSILLVIGVGTAIYIQRRKRATK
ncbi:MAG TPA: leucine-rich repeat domain-containing protein, partial [Pseudogracilibacillus sp.]|nr:leucine-rich repeat domain-containing protein [Pseudogracilibacillus sp.]